MAKMGPQGNKKARRALSFELFQKVFFVCVDTGFEVNERVFSKIRS